MRTVEPTITASSGWIATRSPSGMTASRTRVPFALPASSMPRTGPDWSVVTWSRACSREIMGSSSRTSHFEDRPMAITPEAGNGCVTNVSGDMATT